MKDDGGFGSNVLTVATARRWRVASDVRIAASRRCCDNCLHCFVRLVMMMMVFAEVEKVIYTHEQRKRSRNSNRQRDAGWVEDSGK
jgi:hypothetical protein